MSLTARLDQVPTPVWVALVIVGFLAWWPLGLAILAYLMWSGKMGCCGFAFGHAREQTEHARQETGRWSEPHASGNRAFDEYRAETLKRLEAEQHEFQEFLVRLRMAKDKAEFDQFMAERRAQPGPAEAKA
jgi:hypothetical protein